MKFSTHSEFYASMLRQRFSLPDSIIYYIAKNPKSPEVYQKLIQACKYFFIKNPILVIHCLRINNDGWKVCQGKKNCNNRQSPLKKIDGCKIWIVHTITICSSKSNYAADLISNIYQSDVINAKFVGQQLSFDQFLLYSKNCKACYLKDAFLPSETDTEIPIEILIASIPNLQQFFYEFHPSSKNVSKDTVAKLLQIPHFKNIIRLVIIGISQDIDIDAFYDYFKKTKNMDCVLFFKEIFSFNYEEKLGALVDEILNDKFHKKIPLGIQFPGMDDFKLQALSKLHDEILEKKPI